MTTPTGGNEVFRPTPIQFEDKYDVTKMRRLALDVNNLANRLAALTVAQSSGALPTGGSAGQVLTLSSALTPGWAPTQTPTTFPYGSLTGVPTSFAPAQHLIASTSGIGPAHSIAAGAAGQVLKATGLNTGRMDFLNYADLGDVNLAGLADGQVPTWVAGAGQWQPKPAGTNFSGLTPGNIYTAISPTAAQFLPLSSSVISGLFTGTAQYGRGDSMAPNATQSGLPQYAQLNEPASNDSILTGDGNWTPIRDIQISWSQLTAVPDYVTFSGGDLSRAANPIMTGEWTFQGAPVPVSVHCDTNKGLFLDARGGGGHAAPIIFNSAGISRWQIAKNQTTQSGANVGSDFGVFGYSDAGVFLGTAMQISRSTGALVVNPYTSSSVNGLILQGNIASGNLNAVVFNSGATSTAGLNFRSSGNGSAAAFGIQQNSISQGVINQLAAADILFQFGSTTFLDMVQGTGQMSHTTLSGIAPNVVLNTSVSTGVAGFSLQPFGTPAGQITVPSSGGATRTVSDSLPSDMIFRLFNAPGAGGYVNYGAPTAFRFTANNGAFTNFMITASGVTLDQPKAGLRGAGTVNVSGGYYVNGVNIFSGFQGTPTWQQAFVQVCAEWRRSGTFLIYGSFTQAQVGAPVLIHQSGGSPEDENAQLVCTGYVRDQQTLVVRWVAVGGAIQGMRAFSYLIAPTGVSPAVIRPAPVIPTP